MEHIEQRPLGPDDTFQFKCYGCGKCCKNREDILLNAQDVYRMAKHLKLEPKQLIERYCEAYVGEQSFVPVVRLRPRGKYNACPLLQDKRCGVHAAKPTVCALYPLGRYCAAPKDGEQMETKYFLQPITCGGHKNNTVRGYLESFGFPLVDPFHVMWSKLLMELVTFSREAIRNGVHMGAIEVIWDTMQGFLYLHYNTDADFQIQFEANAFSLRSKLEQVKAALFAPPAGSPCLAPRFPLKGAQPDGPRDKTGN